MKLDYADGGAPRDMCGIVAYTGKGDAGPILFEGLTRLEYRGYDSSGLALLTTDNSLYVQKAVGEIARLERRIDNGFPPAHCGIAHTRWATHGGVSEANAHPHCNCHRKFFIVHNGIIENYDVIKDRLQKSGHTFTSETDTEVTAHLLEETYQGNLMQAVQEALGFLRAGLRSPSCMPDTQKTW